MLSVIHCPSCSCLMERHVGGRTKDQEIGFARCPVCGAVWLDEFDAPGLGKPVARLAFDAEALAIAWPPTTRFSACPRCATPTEDAVRQIKLLDVVIDFCVRCHGLYLDAGELDALVRAVADADAAANANYRAAPRVRNAIGARSFECARCGEERPTAESCILPAGLVCGSCFYERGEAALSASAGAGFARDFSGTVPKPIESKFEAEPVLSRIGVVLAVLGFGFCIFCGRRPYDAGCPH
ncbi:MAG: zf-TFIIB domain-containing protein [Polyangiaceae bacterium]